MAASPRLAAILCIATFSVVACAPVGRNETRTVSTDAWQEDFKLAERRLSDTGESRYFVLRPGFELVLASSRTTLIVSVLEETKRIDGVVTRVVEERESENGQLVEVSRNFFAIDASTGDVFYFGEEVDDYARGRVSGHSGSWLASGGNRPGLIMPGAPRVGMKYFQELAPGVAMDRAEIISTSERCSTPAGALDGCLITQETTPLEPGAVEQKIYAPGIGLIRDKDLRLVSHGYRNKPAP